MVAIKIPVKRGVVNSHQKFNCQLGDNFISFVLNWNYHGKYWSLDLYQDDELLGAGIAVNAGSNLTGLLNLGKSWGNLYCFGEDLTLDNFGDNNMLVWSNE